MNIVALTPFGRFPTIVADPGRWWPALAADGEHRLVRFSANAAGWRALCSEHSPAMLTAPMSFAQRLRRTVEWRVAGLDLAGSGRAAGRSLDCLCRPEPFRDARRYVETVSPLGEHLEALNRAQGELRFSLTEGVEVAGLDYDQSADLVAYARRDTALSRVVRAGLADCPHPIDLLLVSVTSARDLLTAMIAVEHVRRDNPGMHACLADHGYENFSLRPHLDRLREAGTLTAVFDTVIALRGDRDALVPALVRALQAGHAPKGFLARGDLPCQGPDGPVPPVAPPPVPTFCCEPVFWTRVSDRRCYWGRCAFCVQNSKHDDPRTPSEAEVPEALDRIEALLAAGYRTLIFSDEAIPPPLVRRFCEGILQRGLVFRWACRCRVEPDLDRPLLALMRKAGCYEVLCGLEAVSPRMQMRMRKYPEELEGPRIREVFDDLDRTGLGTHVNLIANFPGDTPAEVRHSVDAVASGLRGLKRATFTLNRFAMFLDTPVANEPQAFGVLSVSAPGDMPSQCGYRLTPELEADAAEIDRALPALRQGLLAELGWDRLGSGPGPQAAIQLYFESGHGSLLKTQPDDPFAPILPARPPETTP